MSRYLPGDLEPERPARERSRGEWLHDLRGWLFLGMGLAGILTVALIVTADESYAGIDGMRALRALVPENEQDHPNAGPGIPVLAGLVSAIHDLAPQFSGAAGATEPVEPAGRPEPTAAPAADRGSAPAARPAPATPAVRPPAVTTPAPATPTPTPPSTPTAPPFVPAGPVPAPAPTPTPIPAPTLAISTDRGSTAVVRLAGLVPGDSMVRMITVQNTGALGFRYAVTARATASTALWTDPSDGLQVAVETTGGTLLYSGPLSGLVTLAGPTTLAPGGNETLRYTFSFPSSAPNSFQGLLQDLTLVFDATQYP